MVERKGIIGKKEKEVAESRHRWSELLGHAYLAEKPKSLLMISLTRFSGYCLYRPMMVSRWLAHAFADGPCSVRDFPSKLAVSSMALALASALAWVLLLGFGVGVAGGLEGGPGQPGATARFSATIMAWQSTVLSCLEAP